MRDSGASARHLYGIICRPQNKFRRDDAAVSSRDPLLKFFIFKFSRDRKVIADRAVFGNWKPLGYRSVVYHVGCHRRVVLASGSFLRSLGRLDPDVSCHERRWMGVHVIWELWNTGLELSMVGLETMKGALGATTLFVRCVACRDDEGREVTVPTDC